MATIYPENWQELRAGFMHDAERKLRDTLAAALPDTYAIFPNLPWVTLSRSRSKFGEIDFCEVAPSGDLVVIEQKNGGLTVDAEGRLLKSYAQAPGKDVGQQVLNSVNTVKRALAERYRGRGPIAVDYVVVCPDYRLRSWQGLQLNAQRIVDAAAMPRLAAILMDIHGAAPASPEHVQDIVAFLTGELDLAPDFGASMARREAVYRGFADELGAWVDRLDFSPYALHVTGCAGSGKTQLALHLARRALARGKRPLYTCFNRPLADALRPYFPEGCKVANLDHLCRELLEERGAMPAFSDVGPEFFENVRAAVLATPLPPEAQFDVLIVDEGQDFDAAMAATAQHFLRADGDLVWMDDPLQRLQPCDYAPPSTLRLTLDRNYRSPHRIGNAIQQLLHLPGMAPANPVAGEEPRLHFYAAGNAGETDNAVAVLEGVVRELLGRFAAEEIALVSLRGLGNSVLAEMTEVAGVPLRKFTGEYRDDGTPVFTDGALVADSIYRFKGQQAKAVVLVDVDFEEVTERVRNLVYCGMTRATFSLDVVLTQAAGVAIGRFAAYMQSGRLQ